MGLHVHLLIITAVRTEIISLLVNKTSPNVIIVLDIEK